MIIDSHQHFWIYNSKKHAWIDDEMASIRKDFLPENLKPIYQQNEVDACVAVQADQTNAETNFLLQLANENDFSTAMAATYFYWLPYHQGNKFRYGQHEAKYSLILILIRAKPS